MRRVGKSFLLFTLFQKRLIDSRFQADHIIFFGIRNAIVGFRQYEVTHIMENILFCELLSRGYQVDVGQVETWKVNADGSKKRVPLEVDFVLNKGAERIYVQSAFPNHQLVRLLDPRNSLISLAITTTPPPKPSPPNAITTKPWQNCNPSICSNPIDYGEIVAIQGPLTNQRCPLFVPISVNVLQNLCKEYVRSIALPLPYHPLPL